MTTTTAPIMVEMQNCSTGHYYTATFTGPDASDHALTFLRRKAATHAYRLESDTDTISQELYDHLFPSCEHGMSAWLCAGPGHYPPDDRY